MESISIDVNADQRHNLACKQKGHASRHFQHRVADVAMSLLGLQILVNYLQVASIVSGVSLKWPTAIGSFLDITDQVRRQLNIQLLDQCTFGCTNPF